MAKFEQSQFSSWLERLTAQAAQIVLRLSATYRNPTRTRDEQFAVSRWQQRRARWLASVEA